jgi:hypothetical protein
VFEPPISEDYNTGETPPLELQLGDLFRNTVDEIGGTQLTGAPPVGTQPTQEQQHTMMADFHDMAQHAGKALAATSSVEAEARLTGGGPSHVDRLLQTLQPEGACLVWIGYSTGSNRRGGRPVGLRCSLSDTASPSRQSEDAIAIHETPHVPHPRHEGCTEGSGSGEEERAPGEGPIRRPKRGGEWEPIKIHLQRDNYLGPKFTSKDLHTSLPRSRSHNGPTNPRSKPQTIPKRK